MAVWDVEEEHQVRGGVASGRKGNRRVHVHVLWVTAPHLTGRAPVPLWSKKFLFGVAPLLPSTNILCLLMELANYPLH